MIKEKVLLVMSRRRRSPLLRVLDDGHLECVTAETCEEALRKLHRSPAYDLVFVDAELQQGSWKSLLEFVLQPRLACDLIVCSRLGEEARARRMEQYAIDLQAVNRCKASSYPDARRIASIAGRPFPKRRRSGQRDIYGLQASRRSGPGLPLSGFPGQKKAKSR